MFRVIQDSPGTGPGPLLPHVVPDRDSCEDGTRTLRSKGPSVSRNGFGRDSWDGLEGEEKRERNGV